jgi:hypothetical protein
MRQGDQMCFMGLTNFSRKKYRLADFSGALQSRHKGFSAGRG